jgi:phasin
MASAPKKSAPVAQPAVVEAAVVEAIATPTPEATPVPEVVAAPQEAIAEAQQTMRSALEKGVVETRAAYAKVKVAADETANAFESSFAAAKDGVIAINAKALEALRVNVEANFDFIKATLDVKSVGDWATLQSDFARKQVEAMTGQTKDIGALTQKAVTDASAPIKDHFVRTFKIPG